MDILVESFDILSLVKYCDLLEFSVVLHLKFFKKLNEESGEIFLFKMVRDYEL